MQLVNEQLYQTFFIYAFNPSTKYNPMKTTYNKRENMPDVKEHMFNDSVISMVIVRVV